MEFIVSRYLAQASARHIGIGVDLELNERKLKSVPNLESVTGRLIQ